MAGHRGLNAGMANVSFGAELWSSSPADNDRYSYTRRSLSIYPTSWLDSSRTDYNPYGFSIRCFKNSPLILNNSFKKLVTFNIFLFKKLFLYLKSL